MNTLIEWISSHAEQAHWFIFGALLLAGINIPISADLLIIVAAFLAATVIPEHALHLFLAVFVGCYFSAWAAYWLGRLIGGKLRQYGWFAKLIPEPRLEKIHHFYEKYGFLTLLIGRFIPLGVRNCIFMSSGMSRMHFGKFALWDIAACFTWTACSFYAFYTIGQNYQVLWHYVKTFNILIFAAFSVTLIAVFWYKRRKKTAAEAS
jgi:membrane protein DedA with SNARE-associated domain